MKKIYSWYKACPFCEQGWIDVWKNLDTEKLYLHCGECERGYYNPEQLDVDHSFLTLLEDYKAQVATEEDIMKFGWGNFLSEKIINRKVGR